MANWLKGVPNPFQVTAPPDWWLRELALFDPKLVIFPSQKRMTFILARKATRSAGESLHDVKGVTQHPDTLLMRANRLVRVCEILPGVLWDQRIFQKLAAHDIQRLGGASEVATKLDAMDAAHEARVQRTQDADLEALSSDAYKHYKSRIGERLSLAPNRHGRGTVKKNPVSVHVRMPSPAGRGLWLPGVAER